MVLSDRSGLMALTENDIQVFYSGASSVGHSTSLGGVISLAGAGRVKSQDFTAPTNVTGVTILYASGNPEGNGTLKWDTVAGSLTWKPFAQTTYRGVVITTNGIYVIGGSSGYLVVQVVFASLPSTTKQDTNIAITNTVNATFGNISAIDSLQGRIFYRCFYVKNTGLGIAYDVRLWLRKDTDGADVLSLCLDPVGKNGTARGPLFDENDTTNVLTGMTFSRPLAYGSALLLGDLDAGDYYAFWERRVIAAGNTTQTIRDLSTIAISAVG